MKLAHRFSAQHLLASASADVSSIGSAKIPCRISISFTSVRPLYYCALCFSRADVREKLQDDQPKPLARAGGPR